MGRRNATLPHVRSKVEVAVVTQHLPSLGSAESSNFALSDVVFQTLNLERGVTPLLRFNLLRERHRHSRGPRKIRPWPKTLRFTIPRHIRQRFIAFRIRFQLRKVIQCPADSMGGKGLALAFFLRLGSFQLLYVCVSGPRCAVADTVSCYSITRFFRISVRGSLSKRMDGCE